MDSKEYFYDCYKREFERHTYLQRAMNVPIGLTIVLGGAIYNILLTIDVVESIDNIKFSNLILGVSISACIYFFAATIWCLFRAAFKFEYGYIPTAQELLKYGEELTDHYEKLKHVKNIEDKVEKEIMTYVYNEAANNAHTNAINNNNKSSWIYYANQNLLISFSCLIFSVSILLIMKLWS